MRQSFEAVGAYNIRLIQQGFEVISKPNPSTGFTAFVPLLADKNLLFDLTVQDGNTFYKTEWLVPGSTGLVEEETYATIDEGNLEIVFRVYTTALRDSVITRTYHWKIWQVEIT